MRLWKAIQAGIRERSFRVFWYRLLNRRDASGTVLLPILRKPPGYKVGDELFQEWPLDPPKDMSGWHVQHFYKPAEDKKY